jgi:thymidylate synthase
LGLPFNIASTSLFCVIISKLCGLKPGKVSITLGDAHIYETHLDACKEQLCRECHSFPTLKPLSFETLEEVENSGLKDYVLMDYQCHPRIAAAMVA